MRYVKWVFLVVFWGTIGMFLHYTLPQHDVVRIVNTYEERQELTDWTRIFWSTPDDQSLNIASRDVQFIQAVRPNGRAIVYRNEDTGWRWPPYFKFDTANLYTEAADLVSTKANPEWVSVRHYGWRNEFFSSFPNAVSLKPVDGPDYRPINYFNIIFLTIFAAVVYGLWVRWRRFRQARIDPVLTDIEDRFDAASEAASERGGRLRRWFRGS